MRSVPGCGHVPQAYCSVPSLYGIAALHHTTAVHRRMQVSDDADLGRLQKIDSQSTPSRARKQRPERPANETFLPFRSSLLVNTKPPLSGKGRFELLYHGNTICCLVVLPGGKYTHSSGVAGKSQASSACRDCWQEQPESHAKISRPAGDSSPVWPSLEAFWTQTLLWYYCTSLRRTNLA